MKKIRVLGVLCLLAGFVEAKNTPPVVSHIDPTWESMAAHYQVPEWFQDGKLGVWFHWGIPSSVDDGRPTDGSHYGRRMYGPIDGETGAQLKMTETLAAWHAAHYGDPSEFGYEDLIPMFTAEKWDPDALVQTVKDCGARFIMPVACHHDNFDMYDSSHPWNSVDMGPKRDTLMEWKEAAAKYGLKFGVSTHLYWSPRFFKTARQYQKEGTLEAKLFNMEFDPEGYASQESWNRHWFERCWEIVEKYDPDMFNNDAPFPKDSFGAVSGVKLFSDYINRDLKENRGKQTVVFSCKSGNLDRKAFTYNLERGASGEIQTEPWMWATDLSGTWFYRDGGENRMSVPVMVGNAVDAISKNGVVMLNIALTGEGTIPDNQMRYLDAFRDLMTVNGEGLYGSRPWKVYGEGPTPIKDGRQGENKKDFVPQDIRFTEKDGVLYAFVLARPMGDIVIKTLAAGGIYDGKISAISMLGSPEKISWERTQDGLTIRLPKKLPKEQLITGFRIVGK
jgi:alpha-L-fucosidase